MKKVNFEECKITDIHNLYGGGFSTDGGRHNKGFCYDSDYSTWEKGATGWKVSYYGIKEDESCPCFC